MTENDEKTRKGAAWVGRRVSGQTPYPGRNPHAIPANAAAALTSGSSSCPARYASATHSAWIVTFRPASRMCRLRISSTGRAIAGTPGGKGVTRWVFENDL